MTDDYYIHACFEMGKDYLLLPAKVFEQKAHERVDDDNDAWLQHITKKTEAARAGQLR